MRTILTAAALALTAIAPAAAQGYGANNPGQHSNNPPDSRDYRANDEAINHPRKNPRHRVCKWQRDGHHKLHRHCTWK